MQPFLKTLKTPKSPLVSGIEDGRIKKLKPCAMADTPLMNYQKWLTASGDRLADLSNVSEDTKIAIIGAGMSGLVIGFELLRAGFTNFTIYEASHRIGGRFYSYEFPDDKTNFAELGAMRFPPAENCLFWYLKYMQDNYQGRNRHKIILEQNFPDPGSVPTLVVYKGKQYIIPNSNEMPEIFRDIYESWNGFVNTTASIVLSNGVSLAPPKKIMNWLNIADSTTYNPVKAQNAWQGYVNYFKDKPFIEGIIDIFCQPNAPRKYNPATKEWGEIYQWKYPEDIEKFGTVGTGIGGQSPLFSIGFLCLLRFTINKLEEDHFQILTGTGSVADALADFDFDRKRLRDYIRLNTPIQEVKPLQDGHKIGLISNHKEIVKDINHLVISTTQRAAEIGLKLDSLWEAKNKKTANNLISLSRREAITNMHIAQSSKFYLKIKPWWVGQANNDKIRCITTDTAMSNFYTLDYKKDNAEAVCLLNYVWEDASEKSEALGNMDERYQRFLSDLRQLEGIDYILEAMPGKADTSNAVMIDWQLKENYKGAFALVQPTQEDYLSRLYYNFTEKNEGGAQIYFAGDCYSWVGGWVEGALETGLNTFSAITENIGGKLSFPEISPLKNLNPKSIVYDNPSSNGKVLSFGPYGGVSTQTKYFNNRLDSNSSSFIVYSKENGICGIQIDEKTIHGTTSTNKKVVDLNEAITSFETVVTNSKDYNATIVRCFKINDTIYGIPPGKSDLYYSISLSNPSRIGSVMGLSGEAIVRIGFSFTDK